MYGAYLSKADLSKRNLRFAYLYNADLSCANLSHTNLTNATLIKAVLSEANLRGANLSGANLSFADLSGANLSFANLKNAGLLGAKLIGANLNNANLSGADLIDADLRDAALSGTKGIGNREDEVAFAKKLHEDIVSGKKNLEMSISYTDENTHCLAGWACPNKENPGQKASLKYLTLTKYFNASNEEALNALRRIGNGEESVFS